MKDKPDFLAHGVLLLGVVLFVLPIWVMMAGATQKPGDCARRFVAAPQSARLRHVRAGLVFRWRSRAGYPVWHMLLVSFAMAVGIAAGKIAISLISAFAIAFFRFPFRKLAFWTIFLTLMLPVEVASFPASRSCPLSLINTYGGLTLP